MAYFGKVFTFEKEENFEPFVKALSSTPEEANKYLAYKPSQKIEKTGDSYKLTIEDDGHKQELVFTPGVTFEHDEDGYKVKSTFTVDGDTITQDQDDGSGDGYMVKREFSADSLKMTFSSNMYNGVAHRYYKV